MWIGIETDENFRDLYKASDNIKEFITQTIKNTEIWNECHKGLLENQNHFIEYTLPIEKCMLDNGIKKTNIYAFYEDKKITTYRFFIMEPYNPNALEGAKPGWRLVGHLPYSLDFTLN